MRERLRFESELSVLALAEAGDATARPGFFSGVSPDSEFSESDVAKYRELLKKSAKVGKNPNDLTDFIFGEIYPAHKGKRLKEADREFLKNQWVNVYYKVVLPFLGRKKEQPRFVYSADDAARIERAGKQFDTAFEVISAIRLKYPSPSEFDSNPEVLRSRTNASKTLFESVIPLVIEGLNLNKPDKIYRAVMTLDEGRLIDTYVDIMAHNPALLPQEKAKRYEGKKLLTIKTIKTAIKTYLETRKPSDVQAGVEPSRAKGENIVAKPKPENPKFNITGKFEVVNRSNIQGAFGLVLRLNQAGNWIEGVLSIVGNPQKFTDNAKPYYRFYTEIKDWSKPAPMMYIRSTYDPGKVNARLWVQNENAIQVFFNNGTYNLKRVSDNPILTERHLAFFKDNPLARQTQWFPLLSPQAANIKSYFKSFTSYSPIQNFPKYNNIGGKNNRFLNLSKLIVSAVNGETGSLELVANALDQFIDENIHTSDRDIAAFHIRNYLNETQFDKAGWKLTLASWLYRQLRINKKYQYRNFIKFIYGNTAGDRLTPVGEDLLYQYKIDVDVKGFEAGYFIKGGYYRGTVTVTCKQWEKLNVKTPDGSQKAKLRIHFGELGGGYVKGFNFGQSFQGVAESDVLWMPADFVGLISLLKADAEYGADIVKLRKKMGVTAGIGGTMGLMEIVGDSGLPPLIFGVYSLSPMAGGIELESNQPESEREGRFGPEVTGSVAIGSIWKDGALPAPRDVIRYGNEEPVLKAAYKGDGRAHFKHDSALLTPGAVNLLKKLCANEMYLLKSPKTVITITGHTDMSGTDTYNMKLSKNRALNVRQKIIDICGEWVKNIVREPIYKGEELARKDPDKKHYDPRYRRVDIDINGTIVLSLVGA